MKVLHLSGDGIGGAGIAANRINAALNLYSEVHSAIITPDTLENFFNDKYLRVRSYFSPKLDKVPRKLFGSGDLVPRSSGWTSSVLANSINKLDVDLVHLHWINNGFLSLSEIKKIKKPLIWTLHDVWPIAASEHIFSDASAFRKPPMINLNYYNNLYDRWIYTKKRSLKDLDIKFVAPSDWMSQAFRSSDLYSFSEVWTIPNPLDISLFFPRNKLECREILGLPLDRRLVLFGAVNPSSQPNKGFDLMLEALKSLHTIDFDIVTFGSFDNRATTLFGKRFFNLGHISDFSTLSRIYSACDLMVVPSRLESFGQTASEAIGCGCPVVCFDTSGLRDIVVDKLNGRRAIPYSVQDLAKCVLDCLSDDAVLKSMSSKATQFAQSNFDSEIVALRYADLYRSILDAGI